MTTQLKTKSLDIRNLQKVTRDRPELSAAYAPNTPLNKKKEYQTEFKEAIGRLLKHPMKIMYIIGHPKNPAASSLFYIQISKNRIIIGGKKNNLPDKITYYLDNHSLEKMGRPISDDKIPLFIKKLNKCLSYPNVTMFAGDRE